MMQRPPPPGRSVQRPQNPNAAIVLAVATLLIGLVSWFLYVRPTATALKQATPFRYGATAQVELRRHRWYGIWSDYPEIMSMGVSCQIVAPDGRTDARSALWAVGQDTTAWDSTLWWAAPQTPNGHGSIYRQMWRFYTPISGIYTFSCTKKQDFGGTTYDRSYFAIGRDVSSHSSTFSQLSGWGWPLGFMFGVIGTPALLIMWPFLRRAALRRIKEQQAFQSAQSGNFPSFTPLPGADDARQVNWSAAPSSPVNVTRTATFTINGQPVSEFTQQTADLLGPIITAVGPHPADVMRVLHDLGRMNLGAAKAYLDSTPSPLPASIIGPMGMDAVQIDELTRALQDAGARMLLPATDSVWRVMHRST